MTITTPIHEQTLPNGLSFRMIHVPGTGEKGFLMGSPEDGPGRFDRETQHRVILDDFYIGEFPVTQALWQAIARDNPSRFKGEQRPVEQVSWDDIVQKWLPALQKATGQAYRLPTEAEWEYAAKGGPHWAAPGYLYAGSDLTDQVAWYEQNSEGETHEVGLLLLNALGLYDMSGNVLEWCSDRYGDYPKTLQRNPKGPDKGYGRALRGGGWGSNPRGCRTASRLNNEPGTRFSGIGFRLALQSVG